MATRYFVQVGSTMVGSDNGYGTLDEAQRAASRHVGARVEKVTNWGMWNEKSSIVRESPSGDASRGALPQLFQRLTARDWQTVREAVNGVASGDAEAVMVSAGYIDVGRSPGGAPYVGANTFDAKGGGGLSYRKVYQMNWPKG